jgi:recombinational DNA repair ATPase RecF
VSLPAEITIDGFKSFARRTTVPGMDPQFNAITGLNGSGKSNILDSICFVLGITNMQQVMDGRSSQRGVQGCSWDSGLGTARHGALFADGNPSH